MGEAWPPPYVSNRKNIKNNILSYWTYRTPNARYLEVYHLKPNTSYEFRIWATNEVGAGEMCTISARTIEPVQEKGEK